MEKYIIALGSSHYNAYFYLERAVFLLKNKSDFLVISQSKMYKNYSINTAKKLSFLNCCVAIKTNLSALVLYKELKVIEQKLGRIRPYKNSPRTIDLDVLLCLNFNYKKDNFFVPHKELLKRDFFIIPAIEALNLAKWPINFKLNKLGRIFNTNRILSA